MDPTRRKLLQAALAGAGGLALRGALPAGVLAAAGRAAAAETCNATAFPAPSTRPQRLILITSSAGDPLNANVPGTYIDGVYHPPDLTPGSRLFTRWGEAGIVKFLNTGLNPGGKPADRPMPSYKLSKDDAEALVEYLKTLK